MRFVLLLTFINVLDRIESVPYKITECNLARLLSVAGEDDNDIPHWICLARYLSQFTVNQFLDRKYFGLFQIRADEWCGTMHKAGLCDTLCTKLYTQDIRSQIICAQKVRDQLCYWAWDVWSQKCHGQQLPSVEHCFKKKYHSFNFTEVYEDQDGGSSLVIG